MEIFHAVEDHEWVTAMTPVLEKLHAKLQRQFSDGMHRRAVAGHGKFRPKPKLQLVASSVETTRYQTK